jgi:hypothetical protein
MQMTEPNKKEDENSISAGEYYDILQDFDFNLYLKIFSVVLPQTRELDIM